MTREEAKRKMNFLKEAYQKLIDEGVDNGTVVGTGVRGTWKSDTALTKAYEDMIDACDVAIKALDQEPCENAISRNDMLDAVGHGTTYTSEEVQRIIKGMPPVNPQPKTGHWILSDDGLYRPICDKCGAHPWKGYIPTVEEATEVFKYCPNCGADMRGEG